MWTARANGCALRARAPSWSMREKTDERDAARSVWPEHRISPHLRHGSLQLSLLVLHAGRRSHLAAEDGHPQLRRDHERRRAARAARLAPPAHNGRRADNSAGAAAFDRDVASDSRGRGHRAFDEWRAFARASVAI